jgi:DNA-binding NarL/FixJ family response regulator
VAPATLLAIVPTRTIRVFHCDDSQAFTRLVEHWLDEHADIEWIGAESNRDRVRDSIAAVQPDVVLLDTMGKPGDTELIAAVREAAPAARVIVYSGYVRIVGATGLATGADAYLDKGDDEHALVACVRSVVGREG